VPIAITGASGFLGSHLVDAFVDAGHAVRAVVRDPARLHRPVPSAVATLEDGDALAAAFRGVRAVVANAALGSWQGDLDAMLAVNLAGLERTLRAAAAVGVRRVILVSTVAVHRIRLSRPISEDSALYGDRRRRVNASDLTTDWRYALSKSRGEARAWALADELGLGLTALRPAPVYGPRDGKLTPRLRRRALARFALAPSVRVPFVHARDVADSAVAALDRPVSHGRAYILAGPPVSYAAVLGHIRSEAGHSGLLLPLPLPLGVRFDTTAARRDLGFSPRDWREGWIG